MLKMILFYKLTQLGGECLLLINQTVMLRFTLDGLILLFLRLSFRAWAERWKGRANLPAVGRESPVRIAELHRKGVHGFDLVIKMIKQTNMSGKCRVETVTY